MYHPFPHLCSCLDRTNIACPFPSPFTLLASTFKLKNRPIFHTTFCIFDGIFPSHLSSLRLHLHNRLPFSRISRRQLQEMQHIINLSTGWFCNHWQNWQPRYWLLKMFLLSYPSLLKQSYFPSSNEGSLTWQENFNSLSSDATGPLHVK